MAGENDDDNGQGGGLSPLAGVGGAMPGVQGGGGKWADLVKTAEQQAALRQFALNMLTPRWGNGWTQAGAGIGGLVEGAGNADAAIKQEAVRQQESAQQAALAHEANQTHLQAAKITGESREAAAQIRGQFSVERARLALQKAPPNLANQYRESARKALGVDTNPTMMTLDPISRSQMIEQKAAEFYQNDLDRGVVPGGGTGPGAAASPGASTNAPGTATGAAPGGTVPPTGPAAGAKTGLSFDQLMKSPTFLQAIQTPEGRARIKTQRPDLAPQIDSMTNQFAPGAPANFQGNNY